MLKFKEGLESSPSFLTVALQPKYQKLVEPTILRETTDRKLGEKKEEGWEKMMALLAGYQRR